MHDHGPTLWGPSYGDKLREKTGVYKRMKQELSVLRAEAVVLHRTEQILKGRDNNLEEFLRVAA